MDMPFGARSGGSARSASGLVASSGSDEESDEDLSSNEECEDGAQLRASQRRRRRRLLHAGRSLVVVGLASVAAGLTLNAFGGARDGDGRGSGLGRLADESDDLSSGRPARPEAPCITGEEACRQVAANGGPRMAVGRVAECCPRGNAILRSGLSGVCTCLPRDVRIAYDHVDDHVNEHGRASSACVMDNPGFCERAPGGSIYLGLTTYCCRHGDEAPSLEAGACVCLRSVLGGEGAAVADALVASHTVAPSVAGDGSGFLSQCQRWEGGGIGAHPVFQNARELSAAGWSGYFRAVYGEVPNSRYPVCIGSLWFLDREAMTKAGLRSASEEQPCPKNGGDKYDHNNKYQPPWSSWVYHPPPFGVAGLGLPSDTWVEVSHMEQPREAAGAWFVFSMGSGVWLNTGKTLIYEDHWAAHTEFCGEQCGHLRLLRGPVRDRLMCTEAARQGYDTIQFLNHADDQWRCSHGFFKHKPMGIEIVAVRLQGSGGPCGGMEDFFRAGWNADKPCHCNNSKSWLNCGDLAGR
eukprot:TRINITY_DN25614_c0_g1_i1.p1 TRINITY_DN25614_c0_g1~~TRINITY_DN25614_c0_g1_i1.p1  ORF type:complete len:523 (+),score=109.26 TRINITY_DN25614_c0_g1_i1:140-1708(+)